MSSENHLPIRYQGRSFQAEKEFVWGTHRAMPPERTLERIRPHLARGAITRVADITGLDTIGVPVAVAMRPASATLAVEGGKGLSTAAAMTSAAMEAIERFVAETEPLIDEWGRVEEVADRLPVPADRFPMFRYASISPERRYGWTRMQDLRTDRPFLVPCDLVHLPSYETPVPFAHPWTPSSNGLASGNHLPEAVCAALYEVIERDGAWCWQNAMQKGARPLLVDRATIERPAIGELLETLDRAGVDATILWCPTEVGVPTCVSYIVDRKPGLGIYKGYGCHLDPEIAMIRAVTEAVQSRTIFISGARDDILRPSYEANKRSSTPSTVLFPQGINPVSVADIPDRATNSFHGDIAVMLELLAQAGFEHVLLRELDGSRFASSVARVVVPSLAPYQFQWVDAGERARRFDPQKLLTACR